MLQEIKGGIAAKKVATIPRKTNSSSCDNDSLAVLLIAKKNSQLTSENYSQDFITRQT